MNSARNYLLAVLAIFVLGEGVLAWRQYQELIVLRAQVASDDTPGLLKRLADAQTRIKALQDQVLAAKRDHPEARTAERAAGGRPDWRGGFRQAMNNPEFVKLLAIQQKVGLDNRYASLFKSLTQAFNLSPEQLEQFKGLLVQKQQAVMDALQAAREQGLDPRADRAAYTEAVSAAQDTVEQQIQSALGPAAFAQYQQYEQTIPQRNTVNQVQQSLSYSSSPLSDAQASQLIQVLAQDQPPSNGAASLRSLLNPNPTGQITPQALNDAAAFLAPAQVQALTQLQQAQTARQQMQQLMRASAPPPAPPPGG